MAVATWRNQNGYRTRQGDLRGIASLHQLVTSPVYGGRRHFKKVTAHTGNCRNGAKHIVAKAPASSTMPRSRPGSRS